VLAALTAFLMHGERLQRAASAQRGNGWPLQIL
jgi:hypothetical protein